MTLTGWLAYGFLAAITAITLWAQGRAITRGRTEAAEELDATRDDLAGLWAWARGVDDFLRRPQPKPTPGGAPTQPQARVLLDHLDDVEDIAAPASRPTPHPRVIERTFDQGGKPVRFTFRDNTAAADRGAD